MTEVAFHFNAPDRLAYACRFARKVYRSGSRLLIVGADEVLAALDPMLWMTAATDFVPHCRVDADEMLVRASPVLLASSAQDGVHHEVLLNLGDQVPEGFARFDRLVEVVSAHDDADRARARDRWRHYAGRGYTITRHDLVLKGA